jgi:glycosyltransferase involved in cell wall biosynthesis
VEGSAPVRILGATAYPLIAASARVRVAQFAPFLQQYGVDLQFAPNLSSTEYQELSSAGGVARKAAILVRSAVRAALTRMEQELLLVHRLRLLNPVPLLDPPRRLDAYDFDDALFEGSAANVNRRFQWTKQEARRARECVRRARLVIAGNSFLASQAMHHARRVEVVPSCVDPTGQETHRHGAREIVTVGWIGSPTTAPYLDTILPVLERINRRGLRARLVTLGATLPHTAPWLEQRPWALETQAAELAGFDIGVMPLPDNAWAQGKCGYKLLQYFCAGVPAVATPVGVNSALIGEERGLLATTPGEWEAALDELIGDPQARAQAGVAARSFVEDEYSYQQWAPRLAELLQSLI